MEKHTDCRQRAYLTEMARKYPDVWKRIDIMRAARGRDLPDWPQWCFLPLAGAIALVEGYGVRHDGLDPARLAALAAWRVTQGVYRFDPDLYKEIIDTPLTGDIPHDVFHRLPEWCVYVETPGMTFTGRVLYGFFAHLEYDVETDRTELRLLLDLDERAHVLAPSTIPVILHLGPWSVEESIERMLEAARAMADDPELLRDPGWDDYARTLAKNVRPMLSLLLYLCSVNADMDAAWATRTPPRIKRHKGVDRTYPPDASSVWSVGVRIGAALRRARALAAQDPQEPPEPTSAQVRARPRPHIRRAHWHGYWTGPRKSPSFSLKWLPPIPVAMAEPDTIATTIHPVKP